MALRSILSKTVISSLRQTALRPLSSAVASTAKTSAVFRSSTAHSFSTRATWWSLDDPSPNSSNRSPEEIILLDGCDLEHRLVVLEKPGENMSRDDIIGLYTKTLAKVIGSEEEARMRIYSVCTEHYFAFGALVSEELSNKIKELPEVIMVIPDTTLDQENKDYGVKERDQLRPGCDCGHWFVVLEKPDENMTRDDIIYSYIKTLAKVIGSEEEARMRIYFVRTEHYFAFGALVSEELSNKIKELPGVRLVLPDYGGEPLRNNAMVNKAYREAQVVDALIKDISFFQGLSLLIVSQVTREQAKMRHAS